MPIKGWFDLEPQHIIQAINNLDRLSLSSQPPTFVDLVQARLNTVKDSILPEIWLTAQQHLNDLKIRKA
jgi:hypothetical protein